MIFQINNLWQILGWFMVFAGLIVVNEIGRRTKFGGMLVFVFIPLVLTVYFILIHMGLLGGTSNPTMEYMDGWFHYAKLYAADIGCIGFMMIKYKWGIGKEKWFKWWPWLIVSINIMIANFSDLESAFAAFKITGDFSGAWWASNEGVFIYGGWWNIVNALAGLINIFCMTGVINLYSSKDKNTADMLWPDMTVWFIVAYDIWNFEYTYINLPTHSWYCGVALLLAPTFANALWNKGAWIQNRANTLAIWCMWAQIVPLFQLSGKFAAVLPAVYGGAKAKGVTTMDLYSKAIALYQAGDGKTAAAGKAISSLGIVADPKVQGFVAMMALAANVICISVIIKRAVANGHNPYSHDVFQGTKDYEEALERAERA